MKTVLLALFAIACLAGQAALAQAPLSKLLQARRDRLQSDRHAMVVANLPSR